MSNTMTLEQATQILSLSPKWERFKKDRSIKFEFEEMHFIGQIYFSMFQIKLEMSCQRCMLDGVNSLMIHAEAQREEVQKAIDKASIATDEQPEKRTNNKRPRK